MRNGEVARPTPAETITCIRSGQGGGPFIFDFELAAGASGPPTHTHDEGDEIIEMLEGEMAFRVNGAVRVLRAGDVLTLTPSDAHTFWNPSKTHRARARVTHGARFERLIAQPDFTSLSMYLTYVDPGASRATSRFVGALLGLIAWAGKLRGKQPVLEALDAGAPAA